MDITGFRTLLEKAEIESRSGHYDEAERLADEVLANVTKSGNRPEFGQFRAHALLSLAQTSWRRGSYNRTLTLANAALAIVAQPDFTSEANDPLQAKAYNIIGLAYLNLSDYPAALESYAKAIAECERIGEKTGLSRVTGNIGIVYSQLSDFPRALDYFSKALAAHEELAMEPEIANVTCNIGVVYRSLKEFSLALEYFWKALAAHEELGMKPEAARVLGNIGSVYFSLEDYTRALEYYTKSLAAHEALGMEGDTAIIRGYLGALYANEEFEGYDPAKAKEYLLNAIEIDEKLGTKQDLYENHKIIAKLYKAEKNWEAFTYHFERYHDLEKEVRSEEATKQAQRFAAERTLALVQREQEILRIKNAELAEVNTELENKNTALQELNAEKSEFLGIASHDLKNPLSAIIMLADILENDAPMLSTEEIQNFASDIRTSSRRMFELIMNLLDINKIEQGYVLSGIEVFSAGDYARHIVERHKVSAKSKNIGFRLEIISADIQTSPSAFSQVLDNLISNAVKFSPSGTEVVVKVGITADNLVRISVSDQGPGLTADDQAKLFGKFMRLSAQPTGGEHSTGLGLSIVKKLVEAMSGRIWCESEPGCGAAFIVELPLVPAGLQDGVIPAGAPVQ